MAFSNGPTIVRDGLVLALDASEQNYNAQKSRFGLK